jgi:hypothetical protein
MRHVRDGGFHASALGAVVGLLLLASVSGCHAPSCTGDGITVDDEGVTRCYPSSGKVERARWGDLQEVTIVTTDDGPMHEDVFFLLINRDGTGCVVPHSSAVEHKLLPRIQRLPNFGFEGNEQIAKAMGSAENARFVCWRRREMKD